MCKYIKKCANHHFWVNEEKCPVCGGACVEKVEYTNGDCVACGQLCPAHGYCCTDPAPIPEDVY